MIQHFYDYRMIGLLILALFNVLTMVAIPITIQFRKLVPDNAKRKMNDIPYSYTFRTIYVSIISFVIERLFYDVLWIRVVLWICITIISIWGLMSIVLYLLYCNNKK